MTKKKRSKKKQHSRNGSKRQYDKDYPPQQKPPAPETPLGALPHEVITITDEKPAQNQLTFGRLGILLIVAQLPLFAFAILNIVNNSCGYGWEPWILWSPICVGIVVLLVVISALKFDTPFIAHITWNFVLVILEVYFLMFIVQEEYPELKFWLYFPVYFPHWVIAIVLILIGIGMLIKTALHEKNRRKNYNNINDPSINADNDGYSSERTMLMNEEERNNRSMYYLASCGYIIVGLGWGVISLMIYLRERRVLDTYSLSWAVILLPWYIFDLFLFICLILMLVFSFGASESSVFTINQQFLMMAITVISTFLKALVNMDFDGISPVPPTVTMSVTLAICVGILLLGLSLALSRNKNTVICGKQTFYPIRYALTQDMS